MFKLAAVLNSFLHGRRRTRFIVLLLVYTTVLVVCRWLAWQVRFESAIPASSMAAYRGDWFWVLAVQMTMLALFGQFSGILRYFSVPDIKRLGLAMFCSGVVIYSKGQLFGGFIEPRGVNLLLAVFSLFGIASVRMGWRLCYERFFLDEKFKHPLIERAGIIGAGDVGAGLLRELTARPGLRLRPVLFMDDDHFKWGSNIHGVPVVGRPEQLGQWKEKYQLQKVIIAMPSAPAKRIAAIVGLAHEHGLSCVTVPAIDQLTSGQVRVSQLRPVAIEDLLGRQAVQLNTQAIRDITHRRNVLVTGAGGSIGSEICRQVAGLGPCRLLLLDQSEVQLFQIEQELIDLGFGEVIVPLVGNIVDGPRMRQIFAAWHPSMVLHAAAHKHVPMMEGQPGEAIKNNALATARLAELALEFNVERFVMISTDKAVNPTSIMGASKRLAEMYLQALNKAHSGATRFIAVRFGNVLGSSGSVVPTFTRQIQAGGPVSVTHPKMVRYFMTIPEAVGLVLQSCAQGEGGEIFVLNMGQPINIADLARQMIKLSGMRPEIDIEIKYTGLRPGEKLFEELNCRSEQLKGTEHPYIMSFQSPPRPLSELQTAFTNLEAALYKLGDGNLKQSILSLVPEYTPFQASVTDREVAPVSHSDSSELITVGGSKS